MVISRTNTYPFRVQFRSKLPRLLLAHFAGFPNQREINCLPNSNPMLRDREPRILPRMAAHEPDDHRSSKLCTKRWNEKNQRIAITFLPKCFRHSLLFGGRKRVKSSLPLKGKLPATSFNDREAEIRFSKSRHKEYFSNRSIPY